IIRKRPRFCVSLLLLTLPRPPRPPLFPYTTLFRSKEGLDAAVMFPSRGLNVLVGTDGGARVSDSRFAAAIARAYNDWLYDFCQADRKSTRLNSSHVSISYAVFCLKKKRKD